MNVGYTEFSYGYAFTENLIRSISTIPIGAPVFPNLLQEGKVGYDVKIKLPTVPLFFQYKLPELMCRGTAFEIAKGNCPSLTLPFFRISLMRRDVSSQHERLMELELRYPGCVLYAAAHLANISEFDVAYNATAVARKSAFFSPREIGPLPDNKVHTIAYQPTLATAYFCSEPTQIEVQNYDGLIKRLDSQFHQDRFQSTQSSARDIREIVLSVASLPMRQNQAAIEDRIRTTRVQRPGASRTPQEAQVLTDILVAREIARVDLGVDVVVAQPSS